MRATATRVPRPRGHRWCSVLALLGPACLGLLTTAVEAQPPRTFVLGDALRSWRSGGRGDDPVVIERRTPGIVDTTNTPGDAIDFDYRSGWIGPLFFDPEENIAARVLTGGGITAPNAGRGNEDALEGTVNGDHLVAFTRKPTFFEPDLLIRGIRVILDFQPPVGVHRVRFYPRNTVVPVPSAPYQADFLRGFELLLNTEYETSSTPDILVARRTENEEPVIDIDVPDQYARFVMVKSLSDVPFEIDEIEVYGTGFLARAQYLSDVIDLGTPATIGPLEWVDDVVGNPLASSLAIRMRTGTRAPTIRYFRRELDPESGTIFSGEETETTAEDFATLPSQLRGQVIEDLVDWSPWSPARKGALPQVPNPRQFVQFQVTFEGDLFASRLLDELSFDYLRPPIADSLVAEVFPRLAQAEEPASFRYAVRLRALGEVRGFDRLEVDTNTEVAAVREVTLDGVPFDVDVEIQPQRFALTFPPIRGDDSLLEFTFDLPIFRFGTTFTGRAYHEDAPAVPQALTPGDATFLAAGDFPDLSNLSVAVPTSQIGTLVGEILVASPVVTPNGDGINDEWRVAFNLLQLTRPTPVRMQLFDLSGRHVATLYEGERGIGPAEVAWDGRGDDGPLVPGLYLWILEVEADAFTERHQGVMGVAY